MADTDDDVPRTIDAIGRALYEADVATRRAIAIASDAPFHKYIENEQGFADLVISDDDKSAILTWPSCSSFYDGCTLETETCEFPAELLTLSDAALIAWRTKGEKKRKAAEEAARQRAAAAREKAALARREAEEAKAALTLRDGVVVGGKHYKLVPD